MLALPGWIVVIVIQRDVFLRIRRGSERRVLQSARNGSRELCEVMGRLTTMVRPVSGSLTFSLCCQHDSRRDKPAQLRHCDLKRAFEHGKSGRRLAPFFFRATVQSHQVQHRNIKLGKRLPRGKIREPEREGERDIGS